LNCAIRVYHKIGHREGEGEVERSEKMHTRRERRGEGMNTGNIEPEDPSIEWGFLRARGRVGERERSLNEGQRKQDTTSQRHRKNLRKGNFGKNSSGRIISNKTTIKQRES